jgi:regulator of replication initiation timing
MNEQDFQAKLTDLMQQLDALPSPAREQLQQLATDTRERHARMKKTVTELQDSLDYLRLSIKYLVFDLEATRRENQYLRKLLDAKSGNDQSDREHDGGESIDPGTDRA